MTQGRANSKVDRGNMARDLKDFFGTSLNILKKAETSGNT